MSWRGGLDDDSGTVLAWWAIGTARGSHDLLNFTQLPAATGHLVRQHRLAHLPVGTRAFHTVTAVNGAGLGTTATSHGVYIWEGVESGVGATCTPPGKAGRGETSAATTAVCTMRQRWLRTALGWGPLGPGVASVGAVPSSEA
eukprot:7383552-Prymnesium_polylepis.3